VQSAVDLVRSSGLIFTGTVLERGGSTVQQLPASPDLIVVRVDRGLRVDPILGDLRGRHITVVPLAPGELTPGQQLVFFTNSWIHGQGIAVREVAHARAADEAAILRAVDELPRLHVIQRLELADVVVHAEVVRVSLVERTKFASNDPIWARADLRILKVLRGKSRKTAKLFFPTSNHPKWASAPRFVERQVGIVALHAPNRDATPSEAALPLGSFVALDPEDSQPESQLSEVERMLDAVK
jgi:hypothetical protein